jgi:YXWGXW repeat-containing protein
MNHSASSFLVRAACALALGLAVIATPDIAIAQISVSITLAPPALPVYEQPVLVEEGGIWTPGYWDYNDGNYFWVPGTWVQPPAVGLLWTPGYWGWGNGGYAFNAGYWGASIGFYGGINYGFGYFGEGYEGGHWQGGQFYYNTAVSNVNVTNIRNTYTQTVVNNTTVNRVSFNGGKGGITARPTSAEQAAARAPHQAATAAQVQHRQAAMSDRTLSVSVNHGKPPVAATAKPNANAGQSDMKSATPAATVRAPAKTAAAAPPGSQPPVHAADIPTIAHKPAPSTGEPERDKANQRQQDELSDNQEKQRQNLQKQQADDHARAANQPSASGNGDELEKQHQAQTQALAQRHASEQKSLSETQQKTPEPKKSEPTHGEKQP